eukprot:5643578-Pyramimonas_sp.AAC.1
MVAELAGGRAFGGAGLSSWDERPTCTIVIGREARGSDTDVLMALVIGAEMRQVPDFTRPHILPSG